MEVDADVEVKMGGLKAVERSMVKTAEPYGGDFAMLLTLLDLARASLVCGRVDDVGALRAMKAVVVATDSGESTGEHTTKRGGLASLACESRKHIVLMLLYIYIFYFILGACFVCFVLFCFVLFCLATFAGREVLRIKNTLELMGKRGVPRHPDQPAVSDAAHLRDACSWRAHGVLKACSRPAACACRLCSQPAPAGRRVGAGAPHIDGKHTAAAAAGGGHGEA